MARSVCPELIGTDGELRRYVQHQYDHLKALYYPRMSAFARDIAKGTVSPAHTPDDLTLECVGRFLFMVCGEIDRRVLMQRHDRTLSRPMRARDLGMSERQLRTRTERLLWQLKGFLQNSLLGA